MPDNTQRIKVLYIFTSCKKSGPIQQMLNLIRHLNPTVYEARLITLYPEDEQSSVLADYLPVIPHRHIRVSKLGTVIGPCRALKREIEAWHPDVIHTLGVLPDYLIERLGYRNHTFTCRNFVYDDYPDEYGKWMGLILAKIHLKAIRKCRYVRCCSESLHRIYLEQLKLDIPFIRNGVNVEQYAVPTAEEKRRLRKELSIPADKTVWVYGGVFNGRKNQAFLLDAIRDCRHFADAFFILPGDGEQYEGLNQQYGSLENVRMPGNVRNMNEYLAAADIYLSTSKSEGMPNGVLEAMATGLPVLLSDIEQHLEILRVADGFGVAYRQDDREDFIRQFDWLFEQDHKSMGELAADMANRAFSSAKMSGEYQTLYEKITQETH